ncbi:protein ENHANCED DISEASE RESISTANCE 2-like isoform X5 [Actinidia eriantha]|uniref:protein ENHANCED DISEASE RESISTANCE 2-like isoform X5 n=1 Tax=Actinidia eriantha TaxID=165200 RepID=UPI002583BFD6|nr:protein ENHANCED DISEASE RESISTANCE 2-like isoform X5 [Actinidia eriantha]
MRYFVLESRLLAYYKREPQDNMVPIKTVLVDGNFRLEDRGLKTIMDMLPRKRFFLHSRQFARARFNLYARSVGSILISKSYMQSL